jgi:propionaldehyde dehydrogenase
MDIQTDLIQQIVEKTVRQIIAEESNSNAFTHRREWLCETVDGAVENAKSAQKELMLLSLEQRGKLIQAMRNAAIEHARTLAVMAKEETGYGRVEDKVLKNILAAEKTPGLEDLTQVAWTGDYGLTLVECAPFGVIGSITPSTNPPSSIINNAISMITAGNAVVFAPHPAAKKVSQEAIRLLNEAIVSAGGPPSLICTVKEPSIENGKKIMEHRDIALLSVTGGEAVVKIAMQTGKKVIAAGPGNPPVIVDDTAKIEKAARDIVLGASFDNNVLCIAEKEVFVFRSVAEHLISEMCKNNALLLADDEIQKVVNTVCMQDKNGLTVVNRNYIGRDAAVILRDSGIHFSGDPRLIIAEVPFSHPFIQLEMLMPVLGIVRVDHIDEAIDLSIKAEHGYHHTAMIHSENISNLSKAAKAMDTTIFVKNAPSYAGLGFTGEGYATLTIATPTGEGLTSARSFTRQRRCVLGGSFRIV